MFLKRITLSGFKSFADTVDFDFGPGVTCVVGPNGCGKSNILDAFKWVLGEQSAKSLRGRQMLDMIFNGSSTRKSSGMARVDLVFDNEDRKLPLDAAEIAVSRKLYRSGESEYLINDQPTRLKDVREIFLDTGIGTEAYSIIEQGKVDVLLRSSPGERRTIFEEAAGISRYKARRKEAERRLERTEQNLLRVADVVEELEKRLRSVKLAAGKARNFQEYDQRLRELRSERSLAEFHRLSGLINDESREVTSLADRATGLKTEIHGREADETQLTADLDRLTSLIGQTENELVRDQSSVTAQEERISASRQRIDEQNALLARLTDRFAMDDRRLAEVRGELERVQQDAQRLQDETHALHGRVDTLMADDQAQARLLTEAQARLEDEKAGIVELMRRTAQVHNEILGLDRHRSSLSDQKSKLEVRHATITSELDACLRQREDIRSRVGEIDALIAAEQMRLEEKKAEAERVGGLLSQITEHLAQSRETRTSLRSRQDVLLDLERRMEGVGQGVRVLLEQAREHENGGPLGAIRGLVADVFETDVEHAAVIEAALGDLVQCLVIEDGRRFLADPEFVAGLAGGVTAICLDRLPPVVNDRSFPDHPGFVAKALDWVRFPDDLTHLARHLLAKTVIVAALADALELSADDPFGHRFVTLAGEVVEPDGRVRIRHVASGAGLISRKSELRDIDQRLAETAAQVAMLEDQLNRTQAESRHIAELQQQLRTSLYEANTARVEAKAALSNVEETLRRLTHEQPLLASEMSLLQQQMDEAAQHAGVRQEQLQLLTAQNAEREARIIERQADIDRVVDERRALQERLTESRVELGQLGERRKQAADSINAQRRAIHELETSLGSCHAEIEQARGRIADAEAALLTAREAVESLELNIRRLQAEALQLRQQRELLRGELESTTDAVRTARASLEETEQRLHETQMALAQSQVRRDELIARTREELKIELAERYASYEYAEKDWAVVEGEIDELRRKIERLGNVNLDAITELAELEQRHEFLTAQRKDLEESIRQLKDLIERLNAESRERFEKTFNEVRENFRTLFRKLFGGGKADIQLENPEDILESGIEIVAQPPGKELQSISLMSGGEKTMTAIALVMSIFKSRPSPCAFLDEVDAALDEANNERFNRIVQEFTTSSQFIVITHSKRTMSIAEVLYGITMQEPGVSTRVSVKFEQAAGAA
ncbi:MAG: chromosome segregation protein SMC [Phycisphaerales bacterium]|nr:chromosome segregation protein SMC [Phycisphaerales bacterium]